MHVPSNVGGRTKKSAVSSIMFIAYCVGNAGGSQFFLAKDAPQYIPALVACSICLGLECGWFVLDINDWLTVYTLVAFILTWRFYLAYQNYSRDKAAEASGLTPEQVKELGAMNGEKDMTDRQNPHFRKLALYLFSKVKVLMTLKDIPIDNWIRNMFMFFLCSFSL